MIDLLCTHHRPAVSLMVGAVSGAAGVTTDAATGEPGFGLLAQLGVASLVVVAVLYMLRRSDARDAERIRDLKATIAALERRARDAEAELHTLRTNPDPFP